jgi:hypothetical protein
MRRILALCLLVSSVVVGLGTPQPAHASTSALPANTPPTPQVPIDWVAHLHGSETPLAGNGTTTFDMSYADEQGSCVPFGSTSVDCSTGTSAQAVSGTMTGPFADCNGNPYTVTEPALAGAPGGFFQFLTTPPPAGYPLGQIGEFDGHSAEVMTPCGGTYVQNALVVGESGITQSDCGTPFTLTPSMPTATGSCSSSEGGSYSFTFTITATYGCEVSFPNPIRDTKDTPLGMNDRIPPRRETKVTIKVSLASTCKQIYLKSQGPPGAGKVLIDKNTQKHLKPGFVGPLTIKVSGDPLFQTQVGVGPTLRLIAEDDSGSTPKVIANSSAFAVSAIPLKYKDTFAFPVANSSVLGIRVNDSWKSDSGDPTDLNGTIIAEVVETVGSSPCPQPPTSSFFPGSLFTSDTHTEMISCLPTAPGPPFETRNQISVYIDQRSTPTSATSPDPNRIFPVQESGYTISRTVVDVATTSECAGLPPGNGLLTEKKGASVSVLGQITGTTTTVVKPSGAGETVPKPIRSCSPIP